MFTAESLQIGDLTNKQMSLVAENLLNISVNYSIDMANQLTFSVVDPGFQMANNNYFVVGRDVIYQTTGIRPIALPVVGQEVYPAIIRIRHAYEISSVTVSQGAAGASPVYSIEAMPKAIQQMKRDKKPGNIGSSGYEFVRRAATKYGLKFVGEKSTKIKGGSKNSGTGQQDSVWDKINDIATSSQYLVFVADGTLYFGTQKWFLFKWGTSRQQGKPKLDKKKKPILDKNNLPSYHPSRHFIPFEYPGTEESRKRFELLSMPEITKRENDPMESEGSATVDRDNGVALRPGMTIRINNIPNVQKYYIITSVSFEEQTTDPVSVQFRTPERLEVNGKKPKITPLPIGKKFNSEYFDTKPNIMTSGTVGRPIFNELSPARIPIGTTPSPIGEQNKSNIPNSKRQTKHPINKAEIIDVNADITNIDASDFLEAGNIDMWNRPFFDSSVKETTFESCRTLSMEIYETTFGGQSVYVIIEKLFCNSGSVVELSSQDAIDFYEAQNQHHGIMPVTVGLQKVQDYMKFLIDMQFLVVLKRFPNNGLKIWLGLTSLEEKNRCFS
jgi:hypothetical protein